MNLRVVALTIGLAVAASPAKAQWLVVPMTPDRTTT